MKTHTFNTLLKKMRPTYILSALVLVCSCAYIVCVYKTVTIASQYEKEHAVLSELQATVGEKEHAYIQKTSMLDSETALALGFEKNSGEVAYLHPVKDIELAVR